MGVLHKIWRWVRWPLAVLVVFYFAVVLYRIPAVSEQQRTGEVVAKIASQKITLSDVLGSALPAMPNVEENNSTVEGIDKNNNGIRDDVELAIFKLHPDSAKIRAAELQYAMTEQILLTDVFNSDTWKAFAESDDRAYQCVADATPVSKNSSADSKIINDHLKEVENLVFNTDQRKNAKDTAYKFTTSYGNKAVNYCDIDLSTLPN